MGGFSMPKTGGDRHVLLFFPRRPDAAGAAAEDVAARRQQEQDCQPYRRGRDQHPQNAWAQ